MLKNNGELRIKDVNKNVELRGFVAGKRNLGGLIFVDLRDMYGITQVVFRPEFKDYKLASSLGNEDVINVKGKVVKRESINKDIPTGDIEVIASELSRYSKAKTTPLIIKDKTDALEDIRLKYRYLDLRRPVQKNFIIQKSLITQAFREHLIKEGFLELETPLLSKSTPEGARDYLVPSRIYPGEFYALPQSPQIYKQLFMIAGFDKYFQIAKCLRDEDLRADRQPEFNQIDIEVAYATQEDIFGLSERMFKAVFKKILNVNLKTPFQIMPYKDAIEFYGSDKPDLRFDMKIEDKTELFKKSEIGFLKSAENISVIRLLDKEDTISRKKIDEYTGFVKKYKAKGLAYLKRKGTEYQGSIAKFLNDNEIKNLNLKDNEIIFIVGDTYKITKTSLGALRLRLAREFNLIKPDQYKFVWINDFPMFEINEAGEIGAAHHPFTRPKGKIDPNNLMDAISSSYDLVLNGYELSSGSLRIYDTEEQHQMFKYLQLTEEDIKNRFGFFIEAFQYGVPPHGGIGFGLERIIMIMTNTENIRDVVAFPKTQSARDLMNNSPSPVDEKQLKELGLVIKK